MSTRIQSRDIVRIVVTLVAASIVQLALPVHAAEAATPLRLTPEQAVAQALRTNLDLQIDRKGPDLNGQPIVVADAVFDPTLFAEATLGAGATGTGSAFFKLKSSLLNTLNPTMTGVVGVRKTFATGTQVEVGAGASMPVGSVTPPTNTDGSSQGKGGALPSYQTGGYLSLRQPLLRGASPSANQAPITVAELKQEAAKKNLARKAEQVALDTLKAYWDLSAARANLEVQKVAVAEAERVLGETSKLVEAGKLPQADTVALTYQLETQRRALIAATQAEGTARDKLVRQMGLLDPGSSSELVLDAPRSLEVPAQGLDDLLAEALHRRADYQALGADQRAREVEAKAAGHQLLPKLDLVGGVGVMRQGPSTLPPEVTGEAPTSSTALGWSVGVTLEIPLGNRDARAKKEMADLAVEQAQLARQRSGQQITEEVQTAQRAFAAAQKQLKVSEEAAKAAETKYGNELERYRSGRTTAHILSTVQAELVKERLNREQAVSDLNKAIADVWASTGRLLDKLG